MALGMFAARDARQAAAVLLAGLNGSLALLSHPIRRSMVATDLPGLYHATLELLLKGLTCAEGAPPSGQPTGASNESEKEMMG
jgi:hypothetical protein